MRKLVIAFRASMNSMNGWQRIGVVLSALWVVGAGLHVTVQESARHELTRQELLKRKTNPSWPNVQVMDFSESVERALNPNWYYVRDSWVYFWRSYLGQVILIAFIPVPFAWGLAWGGVKAVKWVHVGFNQDRQKP